VKPLLIVFSGLPATGKTTLARELVKVLKAAYFRLDTIEHGIKELCSYNVQGEGYRLSYRMAADNLALGNDVIIDCCNPWKLTRDEWDKMAKDNNANIINIEIKCGNTIEYKERVENRINDIEGFVLPTWEEIENGMYEEWDRERIIIDTTDKTKEECLKELKSKIHQYKDIFKKED